MVTPPEVFSGASWPLIFTEPEMHALERVSFLDEASKADKMRRMYGFEPTDLVDNGYVDEPYVYTRGNRSPHEQIDVSLHTAISQGGDFCRETVLRGLEQQQNNRRYVRYGRAILRPSSATQRNTILAVPYEELDSLETFFDAVSLLVSAGTNKILETAATANGRMVSELDKDLHNLAEQRGLAWFSGLRELDS